MLTGMVQCRHPDQIRQARKATEEYLKQLNALHPLGLPPAGRPTVSSETIPYYFAWRRINDGQADDSMPSIGATGVQDMTGEEAQVEAAGGLEGQGLEEEGGLDRNLPHSSPFIAPRASARARHDPTHPPAARASATEGVAAADLEAGLVSTPPRRIFKPFKPLCKRRHKPLSPKIGSAYGYVRGDGNVRGAQVGDTDAEDESSVISGESLGPPEFTTEYQRSFQWPKGFFGSVISKPAGAADRRCASEAGIRGAWVDGAASQRAGEMDHLWELLKLAPTTPVVTGAGARPRTDQVWDLLLQPTSAVPPPSTPLPPPPPRATIEHELVVDEEGEGEEAGEAPPPPRVPLVGAVEPSAPTHAPVAPPSEPPTTPARRSVITSAATTPARGADRRGGGVGVDAARLQQQQRQAGEMERRGKRPMVAFGRTVRTPPPPAASEVGEGERGGGGKQGKRKKLVIRGRKPVRTFRNSFNPIFMNPRYPTTRPGSPEHRHSVYQSSFSWPSVSPLMQSIS